MSRSRSSVNFSPAIFSYALFSLAGCNSAPPPPSSVQTLRVDGKSVTTTFNTRDHMLAAVEMQLSGEPLAEAMGRDLKGYSRDHLPSNLYFDPALNGTARIDLSGFSTAVESYEYSKQPMNELAFESGAGTSLAFAPLVNPASATGAGALALLRSYVQHVAASSNATSRFVSATATATNPLGWPGFWPTTQPFESFDPTINPVNTIDLVCSISSDDDPGASGSLLSDDYECDYTSLHLPNREQQVQKTIGPGASGWAGWKDALWVLNYLQVMHDVNELGINTVPDGSLSMVGAPGNTIVGASDPGNTPAAGTFLGSSDIEGFQAAMFLTILDNQAQEWLTGLSTTDGASLGGFANLKSAISYSTSDPLRWIPSSIAVTESADDSGFPRPTGYAIASADSHLLDQAGLLGEFASIYALTDTNNTDVGGSQPALAYFDGDPFPADNQLPDGESTLHDRALAMMRVTLVNLDRLHHDPATGFCDDVTMSGATATRGTRLSADVAAYTLLALRTTRRALASQLELYTNTKPDTLGVPLPLDDFPLVNGLSFGDRITALIQEISDELYENFTTVDGLAYSGWDLARKAPTDDGHQLDGYSAAIRGLLVAYLATGATKYRDRAVAVYNRLDKDIYDSYARIYRPSASDRGGEVTFTPRRFATLQGALRDMYELVGVQPGQDTLKTALEDRIARLNKLVLNGWDDRDQDDNVTWPDECINVVDGLPRGGLQMAERTLSGETGTQADNLMVPRVITTDREQDCVPEISAAHLPSALADSITFRISNQR